MASSDVIKDYLVKLGFEVDSPAYLKMKSMLKTVEDNLSTLSKNQAFLTLAKGASIYVTAVAAAVTATAGLLQKVSQADLSYEKLALQMRVTKDVAREMDIAQKTLGASWEEIVWVPELTKQFEELRRFIKDSNIGDDFERQMKNVRATSLEFAKFKILMVEGSKSIALEMSKYIDFGKINNALKDVQKWVRENMPDIAAKIARVVRGIVGSFEVVYKIGTQVFNGIKAAIEILPSFAQSLTVFFGALAIGLKLNPMITGLILLFGMLEDYWVWMEGKKHKDSKDVLYVSAFYDLWEALDKGLPMLKKSIEPLKESLKSLFGSDFELEFWRSFNALVNGISMGIMGIVTGISHLIDAAGYLKVRLFGNEASNKVKEEWDQKIKEQYNKEIEAYNKNPLRNKLNFQQSALLEGMYKQKDIEVEAAKAPAMGDYIKKIMKDHQTFMGVWNQGMKNIEDKGGFQNVPSPTKTPSAATSKGWKLPDKYLQKYGPGSMEGRPLDRQAAQGVLRNDPKALQGYEYPRPLVVSVQEMKVITNGSPLDFAHKVSQEAMKNVGPNYYILRNP